MTPDMLVSQMHVSLQDYFCFKCFEDMHRRGNRLQHKSMLVSVSVAISGF